MLKDVYREELATPELYLPQRDMLEAVEDARESGISSCYVDVATGVGKTYAVAHDIKKYLDEKPDARVLYLCHKGQVLEQARDTIADVVDPEVSHGNFYKGQYEDREQIVYATFQQMTGGSDDAKNYQAFDPKEFDYVVVDESHHGPAPTYAEVIEYFEPDFQIGLTATDERMDGKDISEVLGPKVFEYTLEEAIAEGVLVKPDYRLFTEHEADLKDLLVDEDMPPTLKEINDRLTRVQRDRNYQQAIVGEIQAAQAEHEQPRTVIYCPDIQYADEFSQLIPEGQTLHSGLGEEEQDARLKAFRRGDIPTLLVVDIFNEGIDVPEINTMVFLRGTESKMIFLQQLGRGLRTAEGKDKVIALDFAASWQRIMLIADLQDKVQTIYRDRKPRSNTTNKRPQRKYLNDDDMVPFEFSFSKDALDAVNIVEKIRKENTKPKEVKTKGAWTEKRENADKALEEMFGLKPFDPRDPYNPRNLPNQRLTQAQEDSFARRIALGDKHASQQYIMHRLRYIYSRADTECSKQSAAGSLDVEDYFQKGLEEITVLLNDYDLDMHKRHPNLRKYMGMRLWNSLQRSTQNESNQIRIPIHAQQRLKKIQDIQEEYTNSSDTERVPSDVELAELVEENLDIEDIEQLRPWMGMLSEGLDNIDDLPPIEDKNARVFHDISISLGEEKIARLLSRLTSSEKSIIEGRYGLVGVPPKAAEAMALGLGITAARVREIENGALKRLAQDPESIAMRNAFEDTDGVVEHLAQDFPNIMPAGTDREYGIIRQLYDAYRVLRISQNPKTWERVRDLENQLRAERNRQEEQSTIPPSGTMSRDERMRNSKLRAEKRKELWDELGLEHAPKTVAGSVLESAEMLQGLDEKLEGAKHLANLMGAKAPSTHRSVRESRQILSGDVSHIERLLGFVRANNPTAYQMDILKDGVKKLNRSIVQAERSLRDIY